MKKLTGILLALALLVMICPTSLAESEPTTLVWWQFNNDPALIEAEVNRWNETYPDRPIAIDSQQYGVAEVASKLQLALSSGTALPDIVDIEVSKFGLFMSDNEDEIGLAPLDEYVEKEKDGLSLIRLRAFSNNGHYYGGDINLGSAMVWYNEPLLTAVGIDYKSIVTREDFEEAGRKYVEATGKPWTAFETNTNNNLLCVLGTYGGGYFDEEAFEV